MSTNELLTSSNIEELADKDELSHDSESVHLNYSNVSIPSGNAAANTAVGVKEWSNSILAPDNINYWNTYLTNRDRTCPPQTLELKLVDGRTVIETLTFDSVIEITECENVDKGTRYTHFAFKRYYTNDIVKYNVDCRVSFLMKLMGRDYVHWSKTAMELSVKSGENIN